MSTTAASNSSKRDGFLVGPSWVAHVYGVRVIDVHNAIRAGRIAAFRIRGHKNDGWAIDVRTLPDEFPPARQYTKRTARGRAKT